MSEFLILRYPLPERDPDSDCEWLRVDANGAALAPLGLGSLQDAHLAGLGARAILVLPGADVSVLRATLPPRSGKRLASLVPYALEDQLAAEIDTLHFAVGAQNDDGGVDVAVIDREQLQRRLDSLAEAGLFPVAAFGAEQLVPVNPGSNVVLYETETSALVRQTNGTVVQIDVPLNRAVSDILTLDSDSASACTVYSTSTIHATRLAALPQDTGLPTGGEYFGGAPQFLEYGPLQKFAEVAVREPPINLLQGPFTPAHSGSAGWERWRVAVLLCVAGAFLSCVISGVDLVRAHRAEVRLDAELHAAYAQALPGTDVSRLPAPRLIVESRVRRLMSAGHDGMIGALDSLGVAVSTTPGVSVKSINFHDGSMEAVLTAADLSALNQIQQDVGPQSRLAGVTTPDPQHAEGRLEITGLTP